MKNKLNVLRQFSYSKRWYLTHPWLFFKDCWINLKNAKMRIVRGWCWSDLWDMFDYLLGLLPDMLKTLAARSMGYPGIEPFETPEKWSAWLYYIANELEESKEEVYEKHNEYYDEYMKSLDNWEYKIIVDENGNRTRKIIDRNEELSKKYFAREVELASDAQKRIEKCFVELGKHFQSLWD